MRAIAVGGWAARTAAMLMAAAVGASGPAPASAEGARAVPPPAGHHASPSTSPTEVAVLAGGCFWGVQAVFQHVRGVLGAVSGYAGGTRADAYYETVGTGRTGHAEAVRITFDPRQVSYGRLLQIHFSVVHDPTQLDRQGPDVGPQYRSAIFPMTPDQARAAEAYIAQLAAAGAFDAPIATRIEPGRSFYPAEDEHQDFVTRHPTHPYVVHHDLPKVEALERLFPDLYRPDPVLVQADQRGS